MAKLQNRVAAVIFCKRNNSLYIPLVKYSFKEVFDIPRGGVDNTDKNLISALVREVKEELALDLSKNKFFKVGTYEEWHKTKTGVMLHYEIFSFVTTVPRLYPIKPIDTKEISFCDWFEYSTAIKKLYETKNLEAIKQIFKAHLVALKYKLL